MLGYIFKYIPYTVYKRICQSSSAGPLGMISGSRRNLSKQLQPGQYFNDPGKDFC